jgi:predicted chitinase
MSATVLNKQGFCESLGITDENSGYISIASPFPVENRPILSFPIGKMTQNEIDNSLPRLVEAVKNILEQHKNEKGIIHCHSYKITNFLKKNIKSKRLLTHSTEDREDVLNKHLKSDQPTVLLSPSMTEGVDLVDDASRFQVICKIPYPYLGDKLVVKRMNRWKWWYPLQTAKTIVQSIGRSVRNSKDYAVTYILDSDWSTFYNKNKKYFPDDNTALLYERKPEKIANIVYGSRMGNGDKASGDGWKYRGRGFVQMTGKSNYEFFSNFIGEDCVSNPDLVATKYPLASAAFFFDSNKLWSICDKGSDDATVTAVTKRVNGGTIGLADRIKHFKEYYNLLK